MNGEMVNALTSAEREPMTDQDIERLVQLPKTILSRKPVKGFRDESGHKRCDLDLHEIASGSIQPQEKSREITTRYGSFEEAIVVFFDDIKMSNTDQYLQDILQGSLFNGY